jgi:hypothetical protein
VSKNAPKQMTYDNGTYWLPLSSKQLGVVRYHMHTHALAKLESTETFWRIRCQYGSGDDKKQDEKMLKDTRRMLRDVQNFIDYIEAQVPKIDYKIAIQPKGGM